MDATRMMKSAIAMFAALMICGNVLAGPGSLDPTFGHGGIVTTPGIADNAWINAIANDRSHRLVVAGVNQDALTGHMVLTLARYLSDGTLDTAFGDAGTGIVTTTPVTGATSDAAFNAVVIDAKDRIVAGGYVAIDGPSGWQWIMVIARYSNDGRLDTSFGTGGIIQTPIVAAEMNSRITALAIDPVGRLVAAGYSLDAAGHASSAVLRFEENGGRDTTFAGTGVATTFETGTSAIVNAMAIDSVGRIVIAGLRSSAADPQQTLIARYLDDGDLDPNFGPDASGFASPVAHTGIYAIAIDGLDRPVLGGSNIDAYDCRLLRLDSNGRFDKTFGPDASGIVHLQAAAPGDQSAITGLALDRAGHILTSAVTYSIHSTGMALIRFDRTGALNAGFGTAGIASVSGTATMMYRPDALIFDGTRIVMAGWSNDRTAYSFALARFAN